MSENLGTALPQSSRGTSGSHSASVLVRKDTIPLVTSGRGSCSGRQGLPASLSLPLRRDPSVPAHGSLSEFPKDPLCSQLRLQGAPECQAVGCLQEAGVSRGLPLVGDRGPGDGTTQRLSGGTVARRVRGLGQGEASPPFI